MATKSIPVTPQETIDFYMKKLRGGGNPAIAGDAKVEKGLRDAGVGYEPPAPAEDPKASKYVDPKTGIRFNRGGLVKMTPKSTPIKRK